jgi:ADP-ribose pyrophosphatase YjhB (NUDIX family)
MKSFNIRVYGFLVEDNKLLLSREWYPFYSQGMLKFPGGGMRMGEGVVDCLKREFKEETGVSLLDVALFHMAEGVLPCLFDGGKSQVVPVYYEILKYEGILPVGVEQDIPEKRGRATLEWHEINKSVLNLLTFEADREAFAVFLSNREK